MSRKPAEQRISRRIPVSTPALLEFAEEHLTGYVELVNLNGMYVSASRFPSLGESVNMVVRLPGDPRSFRVRASVVHLDTERQGQAGFGARFDDAPPGFLDAIRELDKGH